MNEYAKNDKLSPDDETCSNMNTNWTKLNATPDDLVLFRISYQTKSENPDVGFVRASSFQTKNATVVSIFHFVCIAPTASPNYIGVFRNNGCWARLPVQEYSTLIEL